MYKSKRFSFHIFAICIICLLLCCLLPLQTFASETKNSSQTQKVRVGYFLIDGFQEYDEETGAYSGYSYEFLMGIAAYANFQYEFVLCDSFAEAMTMLENGEIDLLNDVVKRPEREEKFEFSSLNSGDGCLYLLMHSDDNSVAYNDWEAIADIRIGIHKLNTE